MLRAECYSAGVDFQMDCKVSAVHKREDEFNITLDARTVKAQSLVIATGGLSIPKIRQTGSGYQFAH